jgi:hypothetical protein
MQRLNRITFFVAVAVFGLSLAACRNKKEIHSAKHSLYDTDFAIVFSAVLEATRDAYSNVDDFPGTGMIKTAWHQVSYGNNQDDLSNQRTVAQSQGLSSGGGTAGQAAAGMPTRLAYKRQFVRFDISVAGGRPWRVKVIGRAAEWDPGNAMPTELRGMARPPWLDGRTEALQVAIYRKMKRFAVPMKEEVEVTTGPVMPTTDPTSFKDVPPDAAKALASIKDALALRDHAALRGTLAADVVWSLGGAPGADTAMAMWQADPETLDAMARAITSGCGAAEQRVVCPVGAPVAGTWQLILEPRPTVWKVTSFIKAE